MSNHLPLFATQSTDEQPAENLKLHGFTLAGWLGTLMDGYDWGGDPERLLYDFETIQDMVVTTNQQPDVGLALGRALLDAMTSAALAYFPTNFPPPDERVYQYMKYLVEHEKGWTSAMGEVNTPGLALHAWARFKWKLFGIAPYEETDIYHQIAEQVAAEYAVGAAYASVPTQGNCTLCGDAMQFKTVENLIGGEGTWTVKALRYECPQGHTVFITDNSSIHIQDQTDEQTRLALLQEAGDVWGEEPVHLLPDDGDHACMNECGRILPYQGICEPCRREGVHLCTWPTGCDNTVQDDDANTAGYCWQHTGMAGQEPQFP